MIKAVVFDMDGVLFDTERLARESLVEAIKASGLPIPMELTYRILGMNAAAVRQAFMETMGPDFEYDKFMSFSHGYHVRAIEREGIPEKPGLHEVLEYLKANGYPIALATSTNRDGARRNLERTGVLGYFDHLVCGDMIEHSKPDPEIYLKAAALLETRPEECLAVEDSPNGIRSAFAGGLKTVMIPDLIPLSDELRPMLFSVEDSLLGLIRLLEQDKKQ
ncbi:MAG: HAD family phosphatase [Oscillospiraceae bacterium]|nr:HAD family phosphatase [Oscillospiraceae bacterium]MDY4192296.1 HAD family phosphatase [Oscillospiraceae bacterium]